MSLNKLKICLSVLLLVSLPAHALQPVSDEELSTVTGQDGLEIAGLTFDDDFTFFFSDPDGTQKHPNRSYVGFDGAHLGFSADYEMDLGSRPGDQVFFVHAEINMASDGFNLGSILFDSGFEPGVLGGAGISAQAARLGQFEVTIFDMDPIDLMFYGAAEGLPLVVFNSLTVNLWEGTMSVTDRDGNGGVPNLADPLDLANDDPRMSADFVWGAVWDEVAGDIQTPTTDDTDYIFDLDGTTADITPDGLVVSLPAVRGKLDPANPLADADGYLGIQGVVRNLYLGDPTTSAGRIRLGGIQIPNPVTITIRGTEESI